MSRDRYRSQISQLSHGGYVFVQRQFRVTGSGSQAHEWWPLGTEQVYPISSGVLSGKKERIIDEVGAHNSINSVDHFKCSWSTSGPGDGTVVTRALPELTEQWVSTEWYQPAPGENMIPKGVRYTAEYRESVRYEVDAWAPWSEDQGLITVTSHICTASRYDGAVRSIIADASTLYPSNENWGLVVGEAFECKQLFSSAATVLSSLSKIFTNLGLTVMTAGSVSYLTWIWGISPMRGIIDQAKGQEERIMARIRTLQARKVQQMSRISRSWVEVSDIEQSGLTVHTTTLNTLSVRARLHYGYDEESLLRALLMQINGVTQMFETLWNLVPLSFAVDGLTQSWGFKGFGEMFATISDGLNRVNLFANGISLPSQMDIIMADWCFSQKTTTQYIHENADYCCVAGLQPYRAVTSAERYTRSRLENPVVNPRAVGMSPALGLAASLGVVVLNGRLPR